jgi:trigger factor
MSENCAEEVQVLAENTKRTVELSVPASEVDSETDRVIGSLQKRVRLPGFRPGKAPAELIRRKFSEDIRHEVLQKLIPKHFWKRAEDEGLAVVGTPDISDVQFEPGQPLRYKAEFEVAPEIELKEYKGLPVTYQDPEVTDEDVAKRLEEIREQKAEYLNVDPRPVEDGDHVVLALESLGGLEGAPVKQEELVLHIGDPDTLEGFTNNLRGASPGDEREFEVAYPDDYGQPRLAGKTVRFRAEIKGIRRKELPELNDEFAADLGDYQNLEEVREAIRKSIFVERQYVAQQKAKDELIQKLVDTHEFPVPEAYVDRQIEIQVERHLHTLAEQGVDPAKVKIDWNRVKESQRDRAVREVKASLLIGKVADAEGIHATNDEVDRDVQRIARQEREPVAAVRMKLEKEDGMRRIASRIRTEKTLNFLFEHARKTAEG